MRKSDILELALYRCLTDLRLGTQPHLKERRNGAISTPGSALGRPPPTTERVFVFVRPDALWVEGLLQNMQAKRKNDHRRYCT